METINFFVESLKTLKTVGAVIPTSRASARKMTKPVDFSRAKFIVELGGGTGSITKEILTNMRQDAELVVFEINPSFAQALNNLHDHRLTVVQDSAVKLGDYLTSRGVQRADYIISTLPLAVMESSVVVQVLEEVNNALDVCGRYVQIQYSLISKKDIEKKFSKVTLDFTLMNFPPAFFYICERYSN